jgi:hypothetical protein
MKPYGHMKQYGQWRCLQPGWASSARNPRWGQPLQHVQVMGANFFEVQHSSSVLSGCRWVECKGGGRSGNLTEK